ncbi:MAG: cobaltochelatase subunit CobN [Selenomonadaceae bacterium]|nr:cobaltochelatase subunit CobN [Selenomonadaceae bacterium]
MYRLFSESGDNIKEIAPDLELELILGNRDLKWNDELAKKFAGADISLLQWMGAGLEQPILHGASQLLQKNGGRYVCFVEKADPEDKLSQGLSDEQLLKLKQYYLYDGEQNILNCLLWLDNELGGAAHTVKEPEVLPWHGVWHPDWQGDCQDFEGYCAAHVDPAKITVGVLFFRTEWLTGDFAYHTALIREIEAQGMNTIAVFSNSMTSARLSSPPLQEALEKYFIKDGRTVIDVLVSTMKFSFKASGTPISFLRKLNVPILETYTVLSTLEEWEAAEAGLDPMAVSISISMPEFDGVIHTVPIATKVKRPDGVISYAPLPERITQAVEKAKHWGALKHKANKDKRIALILHNYPAANSNIGSAAGLDSMASTCALLRSLSEAGYRVDNLYDSDELLKVMTASVTNDGRFLSETQLEELYGRLDIKEYMAFFRKKSESFQKNIERIWGKAPGDVLSSDEEIFVPGLLNGNIFITIQPVRGFGDDPEQLLHSSELPPSHQYLGYYQWLRDVWKADAVIHLGTHGSLEWLPGKGTALSADCGPDAALGWLPNIYPYWMTIAGEGLQAKRRASACLISYLSPPMQQAGGYAEWAALDRALEEYQHFRQVAPDNLEAAENQVREKAAACDFADEIVEGDDFAAYAAELHNYLSDLESTRIQTGMHVLGQPPEGEELLEYAAGILENINGDIPSVNKVMAAELGADPETLWDDVDAPCADGLTCGQMIKKVEKEVRSLLESFGAEEYAADKIEAVLEVRNFSEKTRQALKQVLSYTAEVIVPGLRHTTWEIGNIIAALDGEYIEPAAAGAVTSGGAELLPTGRNFYGLDPRSLPTQAAWHMGIKLADELLARYISEEGHYPETVGLVLWSGANMRSHGQCVAEFLYLMGLKPVWQGSSQNVIGLSVIPLNELKRPRIDVTGRISGLFRDSMPDAVHWLNAAAGVVAELEESDDENYIRKHVMNDAAWLEEKGGDKEDAWARASYRVFGNPPGSYGAGINNLLESKQWENEKDIEEVYTQFSGYAYGSDGQPTAFEPELFRRRLSGIDIAVKNEDNKEINMFTCDDYASHHGGMVAAVRSLTGKAPKAYMTSSSAGSRVKVSTVEEEAKRIFRAETMNPKYIEGMMKHGYKGAMELANRLVHSYQWDATAGIMDDAMYEKLAQTYTLDEKMQEWMQDVNPWALSRMTETLLEAEKRGMWKARPETKQELIELYLNIEGEMEERADY